MLRFVHSRDGREQSVAAARRTGRRSHVARWTRYAITFLLLLAVAVTGTMAYSARQQWWQLIARVSN
jgi:hypothetical protein